MSTPPRYPSDVSDDEWAFVAPYLALVPEGFVPEGSGQRKHDLRHVFAALRYVIRSGCPWRYLPHDFPPWAAVYQQTQRWIAAGVFEQIAHDLRVLLRGIKDRRDHPSAAVLDSRAGQPCWTAVLDSRTLQSTPESGARATGARATGARATYDGAKRKKGSKVHGEQGPRGARSTGSKVHGEQGPRGARSTGSKVHSAVDTLGHLLALVVTPGKDQDRGSGSGIRIGDQDRGSGSGIRIGDQDRGSGSGIRIGTRWARSARPCSRLRASR